MMNYLTAAIFGAAATNDAPVSYEGAGALLNDSAGESLIATTQHKYQFEKSGDSSDPSITITQESEFKWLDGDFKSDAIEYKTYSCAQGLSNVYQYMCYNYGYGPNGDMYASIVQHTKPWYFYEPYLVMCNIRMTRNDDGTWNKILSDDCERSAVTADVIDDVNLVSNAYSIRVKQVVKVADSVEQEVVMEKAKASMDSVPTLTYTDDAFWGSQNSNSTVVHLDQVNASPSGESDISTLPGTDIFLNE